MSKKTVNYLTLLDSTHQKNTIDTVTKKLKAIGEVVVVALITYIAPFSGYLLGFSLLPIVRRLILLT